MRGTEQVGVVVSGYGPVGRAYVGRLGRDGDDLAARHGVRLAVRAVRASAAVCRLGAGEPVPPRSAWGPPEPLEETLDRTGARVFAQALPSSPALREDAAEEALVALRRGVHVVTATKSHLLTHWRELEEAARASGAVIRISGATGAAFARRGFGAGGVARDGLRDRPGVPERHRHVRPGPARRGRHAAGRRRRGPAVRDHGGRPGGRPAHMYAARSHPGAGQCRIRRPTLVETRSSSSPPRPDRMVRIA